MNAIAITTPRAWQRKTKPLAASTVLASQDFSRFSGLDRLFDVLLDGLSMHNAGAETTTAGVFRPALDIRGEEKRYIVSLEVPGVDEKDLHIEIRDNELTISGEKKCECEAGDNDKEAPCGSGSRYSERCYGAFTRTLALPDDVDANAVVAGHKNGILTLTLPRREPEKPEGKVITINKE
jgi:HSP20 family protein